MAYPSVFDRFIPSTGLPLEGGITLFPYDSLRATDHHPRTLEEILRHRFQIPGLRYGYQIDPHGFVADVYRKMPSTLRAFSIRQLQQLSRLIIAQNAPRLPGPHTFSHTRGVHELDCAVAAAILNAKYGLTGPEALTRILAEMVHDDRMPAYGDIIFVLTRGALNEDEELYRLFTELEPAGYKALCRTWDLPSTTAELVIQAAAGKGAIGAAHKLIDARSYLVRDLAAVKSYYGGKRHIVPTAYGKTLSSLLRGTNVFDIVPRIVITDTTAYVDDSETLAYQLRLRLEAWRNIYTNPACKGLELLYREVILPAFLARRQIAARDLTALNDTELDSMIEEELGCQPFHHLNNGERWTTIEYFSSWSAACAKEEERAGSTTHITVLCSLANDQPPKAKTDRHLVKQSNGDVVPFSVASPKISTELEQLANQPTCLPYQLFMIPIPEHGLSPAMTQAWESARARWHSGEPKPYPKT